MNFLNKICIILLQQNFDKLYNYKFILITYITIFIIIFLENGFILASFLPGDSLLILVGALIEKKILNFYLIIILLTIASSIGSWIGYIQGKWLNKNSMVKKWIIKIPSNYYEKSYQIFKKYGLISLLIGRFITLLRTFLPVLAGISKLDELKFQLLNWISSFIWIFTLITLGFLIKKIPIIQYYESQIMIFLILFPLILLIVGITGIIIFFLKKNKKTI
ncbi:DedA family protein [Sodalis-like secondary symbiont of Drepanosiphum platanoidis]|uniref:DedA family protein n=1 Tax=Sodalis-like secondary symbiont of Drepanosiphum platanoidis TaxID=2994493 RepID=UPI0034644523